jgi:glyoxylase-like metal-dependent hydrolase (beta-lactamase superfamily II)
MKIFPVNTGYLSIPARDMYVPADRASDPILYTIDAVDPVVCTVHSLLVISDHYALLVDTGVGTIMDGDVLSHYHYRPVGDWDSLLRSHGLTTIDITDVLLTHLHFDHCGGCVKSKVDAGSPNESTLTFPRANHYVSRRQWEWALNAAEREADSFFEHTFLPIQQQGRLILVGEETELLPGLRVRFYNGHTMGLMLPIITDGKRTIAFAGDLIPTTAHLRADIVMSYDINPLLIREEKKIFLTEGKRRDWELFLQHDTETCFPPLD